MPPLRSLRAFEAAGRHLSFTIAAEELGVTPGAISHQIRQLEEFLGARLFDRQHREVTLTARGQAYQRSLAEAFRRMEDDTRVLFAANDPANLRVYASTNLAMRWLVPRLPRLAARHPSITLELSAEGGPPPALQPRRFDLAITHGAAPLAKTEPARLFDGRLVAVCSPRYLAGRGPITQPAQLDPDSLIHSRKRKGDWRRWLRLAKVPEVDASRGIKFEDMNLAYIATVSGMGVMLFFANLVAEDLQTGRLVMLFDVALTEEPDWLVYTTPAPEKAQATLLLRDWLLAEAQNDRQRDR
ncbi:LysR family glycine cleavage system transcriptional activator [Humitalea rosea]|uniref:LysR family glycine cleavage system transcriptional activator n=1 Tax=Humitalea rosea TaxID=990373 RepID=A0A2W7ICS9_9PROT|nr:LysR substrate-binding domain-containing protein [Humitalea rosea]PZW44766.1 LysR family glycine cleavage system transcriptional activator [Humitalea rosea]